MNSRIEEIQFMNEFQLNKPINNQSLMPGMKYYYNSKLIEQLADNISKIVKLMQAD